MISVIIPMYNAENTIIQTLDGFEKQTRRNFEVIVVEREGRYKHE
jgi:glycosyltransferase involved in cell wall biosynthesis